MTKSTSRDEAENVSAPEPLTSNSEIVRIIYVRLGEMQQQIDNLTAVDRLQANALDIQAEIISRLSQRLHSIEGDDAPCIEMPPPRILGETLVSHNPKPRKRKEHAKQITAKKQTVAVSNGRLATRKVSR